MLATCDDSLEGVRGRALLCFGFASGGRKRSEVAATDLRDLRRIGEAGYIYRLEHSKTQQAGVTATSTPDKPVLDRAALALQDWLEASGITEGAIFRRLWKQRVGPALSPAAVGEIVQRRARLAGLEGDFGGHSLRSGFVTEASRQGVALPAIMQLTEHRSVSSVGGTSRPVELQRIQLPDCWRTRNKRNFDAERRRFLTAAEKVHGGSIKTSSGLNQPVARS